MHPPAGLRLRYAATSDVGRVRKDNQDSGYVGPWLVAVCDGVGGAARGDIASSTAIQQLRRLDVPPVRRTPTTTCWPGSPAPCTAPTTGSASWSTRTPPSTAPAPPRPSRSSTAPGSALGHVGDSRAYLYRGGEITQLTSDHTFVQSLIDEGRITEEESRVHPHRNLILKALDGVHEAEPDLFVIELAPGDRLLLCSDGASGVLDDRRLADILSTGSPDFADRRAGARQPRGRQLRQRHLPGRRRGRGRRRRRRRARRADRRRRRDRAAARRCGRGGAMGGLFRGHRAGDTGELEPVQAEIPDSVGFAITSDPIDPEQARYAPRPPRRFVWLKRILAALVVIGLVWIVLAVAWSWTQDQYFVGEEDGYVIVYRGLNSELAGVDLSEPYERSDVELDRLSEIEADRVREGIAYDNPVDAHAKVEDLAARQEPVESTGG